MMIDYKPHSFAELYNSEFGQRIWAFLNRPEVIEMLEEASRSDKPALEGIAQAMADEVFYGQRKQMVGHMVRQILEAQGWEHDHYGEKVEAVEVKIFTTASRYRRP
jgi:hypothetical protein